MAGLHVDADEDRRRAALRLLHRCRELEAVGGNDAIVVVRGRDERRDLSVNRKKLARLPGEPSIRCRCLDVVQASLVTARMEAANVAFCTSRDIRLADRQEVEGRFIFSQVNGGVARASNPVQHVTLDFSALLTCDDRHPQCQTLKKPYRLVDTTRPISSVSAFRSKITKLHLGQ